MSRARLVCATLILALLVVACGQKPGVRVDGGGLATGSDPATQGMGTDPAAGASAGGETSGSPQASAAPGDAGSSGSQDAGEPGSSGGGASSEAPADGGAGGGGEASGDGQGSGGEGASAAQAEPQGSDRTGVSDEAITVAVHAPVTGAAPLPSTSFEKSGDLYWRWLAEQGEDVLGRTVELIFADDRYEPTAARQVCRDLMDKAFLLVGGGGTDGIQACGGLAGQRGVPYFSAGVTEAGLRDNPWYFASSMSYRQQGDLLAQLVVDRFGDAKTAAVVTRTSNFDDAVAGWEQGVADHGVSYHETLRHPRGDTTWYSGYANQLAQAGVEVIYVNTSPLDYIRFAQVAADQGHDFQFVGVGVTMGLNDVLGNGCPAVDGGVFLSPFPALDVIDELDPAFNQAASQFGVPDDDIALAIWGASKTLHQLLDRYEATYGDDLTREDFRAAVERAGRIESNVFPPLEYTPDDHFGASSAHVLEADCSAEQHRSAGTFVSGF